MSGLSSHPVTHSVPLFAPMSFIAFASTDFYELVVLHRILFVKVTETEMMRPTLASFMSDVI